MGYRIEDGKGSRNRANTFYNKLRTLSTSPTLINHLSNSISEPGSTVTTAGTFDSRIISSVAGSGSSLVLIINNDPRNFVIIDRVFTNGIVSSATLPDTSTYVSILMGGTYLQGTGVGISTVADNTNQSVTNIQPEISLLTGAKTSGGVECMRRYIEFNRPYFQELIPQKSDGIILGKGNTMEIYLSTLSSTTIEIGMRFAVAQPFSLPFK